MKNIFFTLYAKWHSRMNKWSLIKGLNNIYANMEPFSVPYRGKNGLLFYIFGDQKGNVLGLTFVENIRNKKLG